jgi:hypothetical protein
LQSGCCRAGLRSTALPAGSYKSGSLAEVAWKGQPQRVTAPYAKAIRLPCRVPEYHVEGLSCGNPGGPPSKAKYSWRPIVNQYREGKVKSTPGGE